MYEAPEVVALGSARELIRGVKPWMFSNIDSDLVPDRDDEIDDIDEAAD